MNGSLYALGCEKKVGSVCVLGSMTRGVVAATNLGAHWIPSFGKSLLLAGLVSCESHGHNIQKIKSRRVQSTKYASRLSLVGSPCSAKPVLAGFWFCCVVLPSCGLMVS